MKAYKLYLLLSIAAIVGAINLPEQEYAATRMILSVSGVINMYFAFIFYHQEENKDK
jgi:hypothetical protein